MSVVTKTCSKCGIAKPLEAFGYYTGRNAKRIPRRQCCKCYKETQREVYRINSDRIKANARKYRELHAEKIKTKAREMRKLKVNELREYKQKYNALNAVKIKNTKSEYNKLNADHLKQKAHELYERNKAQILERHRKNRDAANSMTRKQVSRDYMNKRRMDFIFRILFSCRERMRDALKRNTKSAKTLELIGCSIEQLRNHLEVQFKSGMNWSNYGKGNHGKWHVDHIIPCVAFDLSKEEEQRRCFHWTNLQQLWGIDNIKKGAKIGQLVGILER